MNTTLYEEQKGGQRGKVCGDRYLEVEDASIVFGEALVLRDNSIQ